MNMNEETISELEYLSIESSKNKENKYLKERKKGIPKDLEHLQKVQHAHSGNT